MMSKIIFPSLIVFFIFNLAASERSNEVVYGDLLPSVDVETKPDSSGGNAHHEVVLPSEAAQPMKIARKIISPARDDGYFLDDTIVVLVKATSLKKDGLKDIEIWEIPGAGLEIINCSYPIKTTWTEYILDYEIHESSYLHKDDLNFKKMKNLSKLLNNHDVPLYLHIYNLLSQETQEMLNSNSTNSKNFSEIILRDFNKIINNEHLYLNRPLFTKSNISYRKDIVFYSEINSSYEDHKLVNRRLLEDAFPGIINRSLSNLNKEHESLGIQEPLNAIKYNEIDLKNRESIVFKYYLKPTKLGNTDIRSLIRSEGFYNEEETPIKIIERDPKFECELWCASKDLDLNKAYKFIYFIKYIGGDEEKRNFSINVTAPDSCNILEKSIQAPGGKWLSDDNATINISLSRGIIKKILIKAEYFDDGSRLSPPSISINDAPIEVEADISVYDESNWEAKRSYEYNSIIIGGLTFLIGLLAIFDAYIIYRDRNATEKLLQTNNEALTKLTELIDKKLK